MTVYSTITKGGVYLDTRLTRRDNRLPEDSGEWRRVAPRGTSARASSESLRIPYASPIAGRPEQIPPGRLRSSIAAAIGAAVTTGLEWLLFAAAPSLAEWILPVFMPPFLGVLACTAVLGPAAGAERRMFTSWLALMLICAALGGVALWETPDLCTAIVVPIFGMVYAMFAAPFAVVGSEAARRLLTPLWRVQRRRSRARRWELPAAPRYRALTSSETGSSALFIPLAQAVAYGLLVLITELLGFRIEEGIPWMPLVTGFLAGLVCALGLGAERGFKPGELVKAALIGQLYWGPVVLVTLPWAPELALVWPLESLCGAAFGAYFAERLIFRHRRGAVQS